jgi:hypothetical protein
MADWSRVVRCQRCRNANPADVPACLRCGYQLGFRADADAEGGRPYTPPHTSVPFVARRTPTEIETALGIIRQEELFSWCCTQIAAKQPHR